MAERLLKSRDLNRPGGPQVAFNFSDLDRQCDDYLSRVRGEAEQILAHAHTDAQRLRADAHTAGAKEGRLDWPAYEVATRSWNVWGIIALIAPLVAVALMVLKPALPGL